MRLRLETPAQHIMEIQSTIEKVIAMKEHVDAVWKTTRNGATLDLEIRLFDFLPFGSHFQVGKDVIFVGLFWNTTSSINGPMIMVKESEPKIWGAFEKQFIAGWEKADQYYPYPQTFSQSVRRCSKISFPH